jgi:hypothetical protein
VGPAGVFELLRGRFDFTESFGSTNLSGTDCRFARIESVAASLQVELPLAVLPIARGRSLPLGGGTYWRVLPKALVESALGNAQETAALYFHPYEFDPERLRVDLPSGSSAKQQARAAYRSVRASPGRRRLRASLRQVARRFRLASYEQEIDIVRSRYGERTRALSEEGELV